MKIHFLKLALIGILPLCFSGCSNDDSPLSCDPDANTDGVYATLSVCAKSIGSLAPQSRWAPSKEATVCNEGEIEDVLLFIYSTSLNSLAAASNEKPLQIEYLTVTEESSTYKGEKVYKIPKFKLSESLTAGTYNVLLIANPDYRTGSEGGPDCNKAFFAEKTLSQIRDYVYTGALYRDLSGGNITTFDRFIMSSDIERSFTLTEGNINNHETVSIGSAADPILVERLAARIDVAFGTPIEYDNDGNITVYGTEYQDADGKKLSLKTDGSFSNTVAKIKLPVYDYASYVADGSLVWTYDTYEISGLNVLNEVTDKQLMFQKQGETYLPNFDNENWKHKTEASGVSTQIVNGVEVPWAGWYLDRSTVQASDCNKGDISYTLGDVLLGRNNLFTNTTTDVHFYTLGYFRENINNVSTVSLEKIKEGKTTVQVLGNYIKASDLKSTGKTTAHNLNFTIMHCYLDAGTPYPRIEGAMSYAIGRNTIYRLCIDKILTDSEKVYVVWYYDSDNNGSYDSYDPLTGDPTPFGELILDKSETPVD